MVDGRAIVAIGLRAGERFVSITHHTLEVASNRSDPAQLGAGQDDTLLQSQCGACAPMSTRRRGGRPCHWV
jgi:hypothetical protein